MKKDQPPKWIIQLIEWYCHPDYSKEIVGDLQELFFKWKSEKGPFRASILYAFNALLFAQTYNSRFLQNSSRSNVVMMIKNYFIVSVRVLMRNKVTSAINILGLSLGLLGFTYIAIFIAREQSFDQHHQDHEDVYRLVLGPLDQNIGTYAITGAAMAPSLQREYPGIRSFARFRRFPSLVSQEDQMFYENEFYFADSSVFDVFTHEFLEGNAKEALKEPNSLVITESRALKIFGSSKNIVGKTLTIDNQLNYVITGVIDDVENNSHFKYHYLASIASIPTHHNEPLRTYQMTSWYAHYFYTFFRLEKNADPIQLDQQIRSAAKYHSDPDNYELYGTNMGLFLQPLSEIHLDPLRGEIKPQGNKDTLSILGIIAIVILALGTFNYTNLTTAQSIKRSKEVGLRKTLGAAKAQLIHQFITESVLITLVSLGIAISIVQLTLPYFNNHFNSQLAIWTIETLPILVFVFVCSLAAGLFGGMYPAFVISSYKPIAIFRGIQKNQKGISFRKLIVLAQFAISMILISSTIIIYQQVAFMKNAKLGIDTEQIMVIPTNGNSSINSTFELLKERLEQLPEVSHATIAELTPGDSFGGIIARFEGMQDNRNFPTTGVSFDYMKTFGLKLLAGRDFDVTISSDSTERAIINETLANELGWSPGEAIGKSYDFGGDNITPGQVIGVMEDYHFNSLKSPIFPIVLTIRPDFYNKISIRLAGGNIADGVEKVKEIWQSQYPNWPFEYYFADDHFYKEYEAEQKFGGLIFSFSLMALVIGSFGLLGIVLIDTRHRLKEICIRKTLGAGVSNILKVLSGEYLKIITVSIAISIPLSALFARNWLQDFAYQMKSYTWIILSAPFIVVLVALLTVIVLSFNAAKINPVEILRDE
ncbi:MAG: ABC transporter permease [Cyclobacteriaceae bacterium]